MISHSEFKDLMRERINNRLIIVRFNKLCWRSKNPCLEDFEIARDYFDRLTTPVKVNIRTHQYPEGERVFDRIYRVIDGLYPCGVASKCAQYSLRDWARSNILLEEAERTATFHEQPQP